MTWTTEIRYFIFWRVINHFPIPLIVSPIVCIYELKYRMWWSGTIHNIYQLFFEIEVNSGWIFPKPLFTEIEKNNCFSIYTRSDLNKIRQETIKKYDLIDESNHA